MLFNNIVQSLELTEAYEKAKAYYSTTDAIEKVVNNLSIEGLTDVGNVLDSSLTNPLKFGEVTDQLFSYVNSNLDSLGGTADKILSALLANEVISADCFLPNLIVRPNAQPGLVDVEAKGVGLALSIFVNDSEITTDTEMEDLLDEENEQLTYGGRIIVYETGEVAFSEPKSETVEAEKPSEREFIEPELPVSNVVEETTDANLAI